MADSTNIKLVKSAASDGTGADENALITEISHTNATIFNITQ